MIVYDTKKYNGCLPIWSLLRLDWEGSVLPNVLPYAAVAALVAGVIKLDEHLLWKQFTSVHDDTLFDHSYSLQVWASSCGFLLVFRGNVCTHANTISAVEACVASDCSVFLDRLLVITARLPALLGGARKHSSIFFVPAGCNVRGAFNTYTVVHSRCVSL
jgi:hypothetical protein